MPLTDITPYRKYVDQMNLTESQKVELIHTVWKVMECYADRAFRKAPTQRISEMAKGDNLHNKNKLLVLGGDNTPNH